MAYRAPVLMAVYLACFVIEQRGAPKAPGPRCEGDILEDILEESPTGNFAFYFSALWERLLQRAVVFVPFIRSVP
jgi:hypothetical protein